MVFIEVWLRMLQNSYMELHWPRLHSNYSPCTPEKLSRQLMQLRRIYQHPAYIISHRRDLRAPCVDVHNSRTLARSAEPL